MHFSRLVITSLLMLISMASEAADFVIPARDGYSYIVAISRQQPTGIVVAKSENGTLRKIPQTARLDGRAFSILCDLEIKRGGSTAYALAHLKGTIKVSGSGVPEIGGTIGKPLRSAVK